MITEATFINARDIPIEMFGTFDRPWYFVGEVTGDSPIIVAHCSKCHWQRFRDFSQSFEPVGSTSLRRYDFITDDYLKVAIYFGSCQRCGSIYWARQGAPFSRIRSFVPVVK